MKKSYIILAIFFVLFSSKFVEARTIEADPGIATTTPPDVTSIVDVTPSGGDAGGSSSCEVDDASIPEIEFYAGNCLSRSADVVDVDLNLRCATSASAYRSYCREENYSCSGGGVDASGHLIVPLCIRLLPENAATCLRRLHCSGTSSTPPAEMHPTDVVPATLSSINPQTAVAGASVLTLTVTGTHFNSSSVVLWNGRSKATTYVSATELHAQIDAADLVHEGTIPVSVMTAAVLTSSVNFTISAATVDTGTDVHPGGSETTHVGTDHPSDATSTDIPINSANGGGCVLNMGTSESLSFMSVGFGFVVGAFFMMRKKK